MSSVKGPESKQRPATPSVDPPSAIEEKLGEVRERKRELAEAGDKRREAVARATRAMSSLRKATTSDEFEGVATPAPASAEKNTKPRESDKPGGSGAV